MKDLWVNFIGAAVFSAIGYFYVKHRGKGFFARRFIPRVLNGSAPPELQPHKSAKNSSEKGE